MSIESSAPVTVEQLLNALAALGRGPVADPDLRPGGPRAEDLPRLLGGLLAVVELEIAAQVRPAAQPPVDLAHLLLAWREQIGDDRMAEVVLANRAQRTAFDWGLGEEGRSDVERATAHVLIAAQALIGAHACHAPATGRQVLVHDAQAALTQALVVLRGSQTGSDGPVALVAAAAADGHPTSALTDRDHLFGAVDHVQSWHQAGPAPCASCRRRVRVRDRGSRGVNPRVPPDGHLWPGPVPVREWPACPMLPLTPAHGPVSACTTT
ncbi:hypothetical protein [Nocardiopsis sp. CNR-923]|uniref:hypothetical protein n=1 Tax=Nocardiopsis sp. CNR-923 TaxID=1904965 RepID=UPI00096A650C|nr:hypothetical protein [Nocardiopsis sp. CNR-923]